MTHIGQELRVLEYHHDPMWCGALQALHLVVIHLNSATESSLSSETVNDQRMSSCSMAFDRLAQLLILSFDIYSRRPCSSCRALSIILHHLPSTYITLLLLSSSKKTPFFKIYSKSGYRSEQWPQRTPPAPIEVGTLL